jgi:hypothetical protein
MNPNLKKTLLLIAGLAVLGGGFYVGRVWIYGKPAVSVPGAIAPAPKKQVTIPDNVFDAKVQIPGSSAWLSYPEKGFYGLGAALSTTKTADASGTPSTYLTISTKAPYDLNKGSEYITLTASGIRRPAGETLQKYMSSFDMRSYGAAGIASGSYQAINGHEFFVYKSAESVTTWDAYTMVNGLAIGVSINCMSSGYIPADALESKLAFEHNDQLFLEILSHIEFKP